MSSTSRMYVHACIHVCAHSLHTYLPTYTACIWLTLHDRREHLCTYVSGCTYVFLSQLDYEDEPSMESKTNPINEGAYVRGEVGYVRTYVHLLLEPCVLMCVHQGWNNMPICDIAYCNLKYCNISIYVILCKNSKKLQSKVTEPKCNKIRTM